MTDEERAACISATALIRRKDRSDAEGFRVCQYQLGARADEPPSDGRPTATALPSDVLPATSVISSFYDELGMRARQFRPSAPSACPRRRYPERGPKGGIISSEGGSDASRSPQVVE